MRGHSATRLALALAVLVQVAACKVVVLGDSNSCLWPTTGCANERNTLWPQLLRERSDWPAWAVQNRAVPQLVAGRYGDPPLGTGDPNDGMWHLERLIREDLADACDPVFGRTVDRKLVIALGTNDFSHPDVTALEVAEAVLALRARALAVPCVDVYVATIPPRLGIRHGAIETANALIRLRVPPDRLLPFGEVPLTDLDQGGVHMTVDGQLRRTALAFHILFPPG